MSHYACTDCRERIKAPLKLLPSGNEAPVDEQACCWCWPVHVPAVAFIDATDGARCPGGTGEL